MKEKEVDYRGVFERIYVGEALLGVNNRKEYDEICEGLLTEDITASKEEK